jgi:hypothetical protein
LSRPGTATRRFGYVVAVLANGAFWYAVNRWPGWSAVPFLTPDTEQVLAWVNASILVSLVANLVYLARDPRWLRALGDLVTTSVGLVVLVRVWQVFPLDVDSDSSGWGLVARVLLGIGIVGSAIGILTAVTSLVRACVAAGAQPSATPTERQ